jgi:hypothetical protein
VEDLLEFLALVQQELGADDARAELGGHDPDDERLLWCALPGGFRVVAVFDSAPAVRADKQARLEALVDTFAGISETLEKSTPRAHQTPARRALNEALEGLASRAGASCAVVMDDASPVLWGCSTIALRSEDVPAAVRAAKQPAGTEEEPWRVARCTARSIARVREVVATPTTDERIVIQEDDLGCLARGFGGIYLLLLTYEGRFSELHAEGALVRSLPGIERLVESLPPVEPPGGGGRVIRLPLRPRGQ